MSMVGGIVGTSEVFLVASAAGLLAVTLLLSPFTTVTRVGSSLSLVWLDLWPSHSAWWRRCMVMWFRVLSHQQCAIASEWVE